MRARAKREVEPVGTGDAPSPSADGSVQSQCISRRLPSSRFGEDRHQTCGMRTRDRSAAEEDNALNSLAFARTGHRPPVRTPAHAREQAAPYRVAQPPAAPERRIWSLVPRA